MKTINYPLRGWNIVGWTALSIAFIFLGIVIVHGILAIAILLRSIVPLSKVFAFTFLRKDKLSKKG